MGAARLAGVLLHFGAAARAIATLVAAQKSPAAAPLPPPAREGGTSPVPGVSPEGCAAPLPPGFLAQARTALEAGVGVLRAIARAAGSDAGDAAMVAYYPAKPTPAARSGGGGAEADVGLALAAECDGLRPLVGAIRTLRAALGAACGPDEMSGALSRSPLTVWCKLSLAHAAAGDGAASARGLVALLGVDAAVGAAASRGTLVEPTKRVDGALTCLRGAAEALVHAGTCAVDECFFDDVLLYIWYLYLYLYFWRLGTSVCAFRSVRDPNFLG